MEDNIKTSRRQFLKVGGAAIAMIPVVALSGNAFAATNAQMRASMKYQDTAKDGKNCAGCMHFVPGKAAADLGGCKIFPGDTEISPKAWCAGWMAKP
jgi:anaerobic selenocysteine-containing dehydrogenase